MSDEDLQTLMTRLQDVTDAGLRARRADSNSAIGAFDAGLANEAALAVNELLAVRAILRLSAGAARGLVGGPMN